MIGRTHVTTAVPPASLVALTLVACGAPLGVCLASIPVGAYAALLPDLDHPRSTATWSVPPITWPLSWAIRGAPYEFAWPLFGRKVYSGRLLPWTVRHRGITHREEAAPVFGLVLTLPLWFVTWWTWVFALQIAVGCLVHLWGDMRTTGGLPHRRNRYRRRTIGRTFDVGSDYEHWLRGTIYRPVAIASVVVSVVLMGMIGGPT